MLINDEWGMGNEKVFKFWEGEMDNRSGRAKEKTWSLSWRKIRRSTGYGGHYKEVN